MSALAPAPSSAGRNAMRRSVYWAETVEVDRRPPLEVDRETDVCVVGGGYTGLWSALMLKEAEPSVDVVVLEREHAGVGASGHNDGFITPTVGHGLHSLARVATPEQAAAATSTVGRSILEIKRFCTKHGVAADFDPSGVLTVATNAAQERELLRDRELGARLGMRVPDLLDAAAVRDRIGSEALRSALPAGGALVNPYKLARGLARVCVERGIALYEGTPAVSVEQDAAGHVVRTPGRTVRARRLLLATNAYQHQFAAHRRSVAPVWSYAMVSDPLTDQQLDRVHWPSGEGFVELRNFIVFARLTPEQRLLVGGGPAPYHLGRDMHERHIDAPAIFDYLRRTLVRYFPQWCDVTWSHAYGGCVAMTRDLLPHVGRRPDGVVYAHGYCGNGIAMTHAASKAVRDLLLERETAETRQVYVRAREPRLPPEPLLAVGARLLTRTLQWQDEHPHGFARFGGIG